MNTRNDGSNLGDAGPLISQTLGSEESKTEDISRTTRDRMNSNHVNNNSTNYTTA
jgi:hypothetical protein